MPIVGMPMPIVGIVVIGIDIGICIGICIAGMVGIAVGTSANDKVLLWNTHMSPGIHSATCPYSISVHSNFIPAARKTVRGHRDVDIAGRVHELLEGLVHRRRHVDEHLLEARPRCERRPR